jgi:hypothetical protein
LHETSEIHEQARVVVPPPLVEGGEGAGGLLLVDGSGVDEELERGVALLRLGEVHRRQPCRENDQ